MGQLPFTLCFLIRQCLANHDSPVELGPLQDQDKEQGKAASGKEGEGGKAALMHPAQPVPVRLESESLDDGKGASKGNQEGSKGKQEGTKSSQGSAKELASVAEASFYLT